MMSSTHDETGRRAAGGDATTDDADIPADAAVGASAVADGGAAVLSDDEVARLRLVLLRLARQIRSHSAGDITPSQLAVVATLARHGPCTIGQLAEYEHVRAPTISKIAEAVVAKGLADRVVDTADRRRVMVTLSAAGERLLLDIRQAALGWLAPQVKGLPPDDVAAVRAALPVLERLLAADR